MLKSSLPRESNSAAGEFIVIQGVSSECLSTSNSSEVRLSVRTPIVVGVVFSLPMTGVSMLLGNELAGGEVIIHSPQSSSRTVLIMIL